MNGTPSLEKELWMNFNAEIELQDLARIAAQAYSEPEAKTEGRFVPIDYLEESNTPSGLDSAA